VAASTLESRLAVLEERANRVQDAENIKRLQRAYGYYLDQGQWDLAADLFADDGTIEVGLDGVYVGRERVRAYLYALGGGRSGLPAGRLNEHMQVMPVVDVAADGLTAKARWREILMLGTFGDSAQWGEGPMENEYVKENGVWKIKALHWYESMLVPYDKGWAKGEDESGGVHVSQTLPPDRPPTVEYRTWPGVYLPPFHFTNPVTALQPRHGPTFVLELDGHTKRSPEEIARRKEELERDATAARRGAYASLIESASAPAKADFARHIAALTKEVDVSEAARDVENLQSTLGYYLDKDLWSEAASLFAKDGTVEVGNQGVYKGPQRIQAFLTTLGPELPQDGRLNDHMQLDPVIHVAPDGRSAKARWLDFAQTAVHGARADWGLGTEENEYVREDGVWKIARLKLYPRMSAPYEQGWGVLANPAPGQGTQAPPDEPSKGDVAVYPAAFVAPYHYDNPVLGRPVYFQSPADFADPPSTDVDAGALAASLDALEKRVTKLEDIEAVERLHAIYGYYLASNSWDDFADLFADDGTIEIAMRGVYVGKPSVRRSMELYGTAGSRDGLLHNHMQFQPVIHISDDGMIAHIRSRALSIMGEHGRYAVWMGGVYENTYEKGDDGVWRVKVDRQINTFFAPYDSGWKDLKQSNPPGVSQTIPPDRPPSSPFVLYPQKFFVPFHYPNPVTGREVLVPGP
jgi:hypothetical protein